ncbi:hypothetical protein ACFL2T_06175 [Elusimicrobiota bacterium]
MIKKALASLLSVAVALISLPGPVSAAEASVLPEGLCAALPPVTDENILQDVLDTAPHLFKEVSYRVYQLSVPVRAIPEDLGVEILEGARVKGWTAIDFISDAGFRGECAYYLSEATIKALDDNFTMHMATPFSGQTTDRKTFRMRAMVLGRSQLSMRYARNRTRYYNSRSKRTLSLKRTVHFDIQVSDQSGERIQYLDNVRNMEVQTGFPFGWEPIERIRKREGKVHSWVLGKWRGGAAALPIGRKDPAALEVPCARYEAPVISHEALLRTSPTFGALQRLSASPALWTGR